MAGRADVPHEARADDVAVLDKEVLSLFLRVDCDVVVAAADVVGRESALARGDGCWEEDGDDREGNVIMLVFDVVLLSAATAISCISRVRKWRRATSARDTCWMRHEKNGVTAEESDCMVTSSKAMPRAISTE